MLSVRTALAALEIDIPTSHQAKVTVASPLSSTPTAFFARIPDWEIQELLVLTAADLHLRPLTPTSPRMEPTLDIVTHFGKDGARSWELSGDEFEEEDWFQPFQPEHPQLPKVSTFPPIGGTTDGSNRQKVDSVDHFRDKGLLNGCDCPWCEDDEKLAGRAPIAAQPTSEVNVKLASRMTLRNTQRFQSSLNTTPIKRTVPIHSGPCSCVTQLYV